MEKKRRFLENELDKLRDIGKSEDDDANGSDDSGDYEFDPDSDLPVSEKKTREKRFLK